MNISFVLMITTISGILMLVAVALVRSGKAVSKPQKKAPKICLSCDRNLRTAAIFCHHCGTRIKSDENHSYQENKKVVSGPVKWFSLLVIILSILILVVPKYVKESRRDKCRNNMLLIDHAKEVCAIRECLSNGEWCSFEDTARYFKGGSPTCPTASARGYGEYSYNPIGTTPECSIHGSLEEVGSE